MIQEWENKAAGKILEEEEKRCFDFFWNEVSESEKSYGLIRDNDVERDMCSIASVGYGLAGLAVGVERGYVTREEAEQRAIGTLVTLKEKTERVHGFFYHFLHMEDASRYGKSEVSVIDTALLLMGGLVAGNILAAGAGNCGKNCMRRLTGSGIGILKVTVSIWDIMRGKAISDTGTIMRNSLSCISWGLPRRSILWICPFL